MAHIDPALEEAAHAQPDALLAVIVRVEGDMDACQAELEAGGMKITRRLWLVRGFACTATGSAIASLTAHEWVISIEPDMQMRTMDVGETE